MAILNAEFEKWLKAMDIMLNATGRVPQYMVDDFHKYMISVPEERKKNFCAMLNDRYSRLLSFLE